MSDVVQIIAAIAVVAYVIGRQTLGEPLRGKRVVLLPAILTVIGISTLNDRHLRPVDLACLTIGGLLAAVIGLAQGGMLRLESRNGGLWGRMPLTGLWLWLALVLSRVVMTLIATGLDAKVAASTASVLLLLGINRLGQGAVIVTRAMIAGIPFSPEKDGQTFLPALIKAGPTPAGPTPARPASIRLSDRSR